MAGLLIRREEDLLQRIEEQSKKYALKYNISHDQAYNIMLDCLSDIIGTGCDDDFELDSFIRKTILNEKKKKGEGRSA